MVKRAAFSGLVLIMIGLMLVGCQPTPDLESLPAASPEPTQTTASSTIETETPAEQEAETIPGGEESPESADHVALPGPVGALAADLEGLDLADFFEVSFRALTQRSPETVVAIGLTDLYGVEAVLLDDISAAYQRETFQMLALVLEMLERYDRTELKPEEQISYDVYRWYLEDQLAGQDFQYHDYPATYYPITSVHEDLLHFFTEIHPVRDLRDAEDYVARLGLVGIKIDQLIENLELRAQAGITPPQFAIQWSVYGDLGQFVETSAINNSLYTSFKEKLDPLSSITPQNKQILLADAEETITEVVLPAYKKLLGYMSRMETYRGDDSGVWRLPRGEAYYAYRLHHFTSTDLSADVIHQLGLDELARIHAEMRGVFDQLGYPPNITIPEAYDRVAQEGGHVAGDQVIRIYEDLIAEAEQNLDAAFDIRPKTGVIVVPDPYGDFYVHPSIDGSRPGAFYAGVGASGKEAYAMPTLAYHETIPGHHLQIALAQEMRNLPSFRQGLTFSAYAEGWALYAERLAWELGWYQDDSYGYLGFLQAQAFRAARLVVDTGLHQQGWTFDKAQAFFTENTGFEVSDNVNPQYQIARYLVWPGQSTSYYIGFLKIMELRQRAMDALGDQFEIKEFHRILLTNGSLPLEVLETVVDAYIEEKTGA